MEELEGAALLQRERGQREVLIDNALVPIHFIIEMTCWSGLAPWEFEFPFSGSLTSTFLVRGVMLKGSQGCCLPRQTSRVRGRLIAKVKHLFTVITVETCWSERGVMLKGLEGCTPSGIRQLLESVNFWSGIANIWY